jgi:hypothetical protein
MKLNQPRNAAKASCLLLPARTMNLLHTGFGQSAIQILQESFIVF